MDDTMAMEVERSEVAHRHLSREGGGPASPTSGHDVGRARQGRVAAFAEDFVDVEQSLGAPEND